MTTNVYLKRKVENFLQLTNLFEFNATTFSYTAYTSFMVEFNCCEQYSDAPEMHLQFSGATAKTIASLEQRFML